MTPYFLLATAVTLLAALSYRVALRHSSLSLAGAGIGRLPGPHLGASHRRDTPEAPDAAESGIRAARQWTIFDVLAVTALIGFSGFRYQVGTDYPTYELVFNSMNSSDWGGAFADSTQEVGYTTLMLVIKQFTEDPKALFWVAAVLTVIPVYLGIKRVSVDPGFSVALFVALEYAASFNALRQYIAGSLIFLAWTYLGKRNVVFWVLAVLALSFHMTAILAVVVLLLVRHWKPTLHTTALVMACAVVGAAAVRVAPSLLPFLDALNPRYADYLESGQTGIGSYLQIVAYTAMLLLAVTLGSRRAPLTRTDSQLSVYLLVAIALMIVGTQAIVLTRLAGYFATFAIVLVPNRIARMEDRAVVTLLVLLAVGGYFAMDIMNYGEVIPYRTYLGH